MTTTIICDRCGKTVEGFIYRGGTAGFYDTSTPYPWGKYANPGEKIVCDACMWADPRYIKDYGDNRPKIPAPAAAENGGDS